MRVDLRGGHAGVPEQFLHGAHVRAALDQVRGKGMAQGVRMEWFGDAGPLPGCFDDFPYRLPRDALAAFVEKQCAPLGNLGAGALFQLATPRIEVCGDGPACVTAQGHKPLLGALAHESRDVLVQVDVVQIRTGGFRDAAAGGVHEFEQGLVP